MKCYAQASSDQTSIRPRCLYVVASQEKLSCNPGAGSSRGKASFLEASRLGYIARRNPICFITSQAPSSIYLLKPPIQKPASQNPQMLIPNLNIQPLQLLNQRLILLKPKAPLERQQRYHPLRHARIRRITQKAPRPPIKRLRSRPPARRIYHRGLRAPDGERRIKVFKHRVEVDLPGSGVVRGELHPAVEGGVGAGVGRGNGGVEDGVAFDGVGVFVEAEEVLAVELRVEAASDLNGCEAGLASGGAEGNIEVLRVVHGSLVERRHGCGAKSCRVEIFPRASLPHCLDDMEDVTYVCLPTHLTRGA
jgi:hypothetical protein